MFWLFAFQLYVWEVLYKHTYTLSSFSLPENISPRAVKPRPSATWTTASMSTAARRRWAAIHKATKPHLQSKQKNTISVQTHPGKYSTVCLIMTSMWKYCEIFQCCINMLSIKGRAWHYLTSIPHLLWPVLDERRHVCVYQRPVESSAETETIQQQKIIFTV